MIFIFILIGGLGVLGSIFLSAYFSGTETAAYSSSKLALRVLAEAGDRRATCALSHLDNPGRFVTTALIGTNISTYLCALIMTAMLIKYGWGAQADLLATLILTPVCFIFAEVLPKRLAISWPTPYMLYTARLNLVFRVLFAPLGVILGGVGQGCRIVLARLGYVTAEASGHAVLHQHITASVNAGEVSSTQQRMVERILAVEVDTVGDLMRAESKAFAVQENDTCREAARKIVAAGLGRAALQDRSGRLTPRYVSLKKLMKSIENFDQPVGDFAEAALTLDQNTDVHKAFARLNDDHTRLAIITGKSGLPIGVLTLSDILSPIVGAMKL